MSNEFNRLQKPSADEIESSCLPRGSVPVACHTAVPPFLKRDPNRVSPLGLTEIGMLDDEALTIAIQLETDRGLHGIVGEQLVKNGTHSLDQATRSEIEFLQFAVLQKIAGSPVSPSQVADEYWHQFILNTALYTNWCQRNFGQYVHHRPEPRSVLSLRGIPEASSALFRKYFGMQGQMAHCANGHDCHGNCTVH